MTSAFDKIAAKSVTIADMRRDLVAAMVIYARCQTRNPHGRYAWGKRVEALGKKISEAEKAEARAARAAQTPIAV